MQKHDTNHALMEKKQGKQRKHKNQLLNVESKNAAPFYY
jgi:hypothetical protein